MTTKLRSQSKAASQPSRKPDQAGFIQRKCACGGSPGLAGECAECASKRRTLQRRAVNESEVSAVPPIVHEVLRSPGQPLDPSTRAFFEPRFGHDFSQVRVHTDAKARESAHAVNALAFTVGRDVVFSTGQYAPETMAGKRLVAHELAHVVQQQHGKQAAVLQRQAAAGSPVSDLEQWAEKKATEQLTNLANKPSAIPSGYTHAGCPSNFCQPFADKTTAIADLAWAGPLLLVGIARKVNSRVVPLWASYLTGGSAPQNLSGDFGADFTNSPTTADTTKFLLGELRKNIEANHTALMAGASTVTIDFAPRLSAALVAITTPGDPSEMNFDFIGDIAGNIAGGIGTDQLAFPIGARPSPFNDARHANISALLSLRPDGSLLIQPSITFSIRDTIDLCPGNCGAAPEQVATIPMSRFEATGLAGDVPFTIQFPAPSSLLMPFVVSPSTPPAPSGPVTGEVTASELRIRSSASTSAKVIGSYTKGTIITILCDTSGTPVDGNVTWDKTDRGFVSDRYVHRTGQGILPSC